MMTLNEYFHTEREIEIKDTEVVHEVTDNVIYNKTSGNFHYRSTLTNLMSATSNATFNLDKKSDSFAVHFTRISTF